MMSRLCRVQGGLIHRKSLMKRFISTANISLAKLRDSRLTSRRLTAMLDAHPGWHPAWNLWDERRRAGALHDVKCSGRTAGFTTTAANVASPPPHRVPHPRNNLPQYRRRRREIQPREPRVAIRTKGLAKIQPNPGLIQKELPGRARQFQRPAVEPGQIRRLRHPHRHTRKLVGEH